MVCAEVICEYCYRGLLAWKSESIKHKMKYVQPTIWLRRTEHSSENCYFCLSHLKSFGFQYKTREKIDYDDVTMSE